MSVTKRGIKGDDHQTASACCSLEFTSLTMFISSEDTSSTGSERLGLNPSRHGFFLEDVRCDS